MSTESDVQKASEKHYEALSGMANGKPGTMKGVWSHSATVTAMHPIGGREVGWDAVEASFDQVASLASAGRIALEERSLQVAGDMAYELGVERGSFTMAGHEVAIDQRVTNVYHREAGVWKLVHHHSDVSPVMMDVLKEIQAAS